MFIKESEWIWENVKPLEISRSFTILDIGSQTAEYRNIKQPFLGNLYVSLSTFGRIYTLDMDPLAEPDYLCDISLNTSSIPNKQFDLVMACNIIEHIYREKFDCAIRNIASLSNRYLVITSPLYYNWHFQPIDNGLRLTPEEIANLFPEFKTISSNSWKDEHYLSKYKDSPEPWVSGVVLERK